MSVLNFIAGIFKPVADLVDDLTLSKEEKEQFRLAQLQQQYAITQKMMEYESTVLKAQQDVLVTEAKSDSWLTKNWRPITMLTFLVLIVADQTGLLAFRLAEQAWTLLQLGIGGYVVGRSAEKVLPTVLDALKKKPGA